MVCVIECNECKKQYVKETEKELHVVMNAHHLYIKHWRLEKPVAKHFNSMGHSLEDLSMYVIEKAKKATGFRLSKRWSQKDWRSNCRPVNTLLDTITRPGRGFAQFCLLFGPLRKFIIRGMRGPQSRATWPYIWEETRGGITLCPIPTGSARLAITDLTKARTTLKPRQCGSEVNI